MLDHSSILIPDHLVHLLDEKALTKAYFNQLAGTHHPWDVDLRCFKEIRRQLVQIEKQVRSAKVGHEITCIIAGKGAFWTTRDVAKEFLEHLKTPIQTLKEKGPLPVWKMTSAELFHNHITNLKQMILAVAYDMIVIHQLRDRLGSDLDTIQRELENCELTIRGLLDDIYDQDSNLEFANQEEIMLVERCRVTMEMLERGETTENQLGYTQRDLLRVMGILDQKCKREMPSYSKRISSVYNQMKENMREGEASTLTWASRWEMAYTLVNEIPRSLRAQASLVNMEYQGINSVVNSREEELGQSDIGQHALKAAHQAEELKHPTPKPKKVLEPLPDVQPKKKAGRMVYTSRNQKR